MHRKRTSRLILLIGAVALAAVSGPVRANGQPLLPLSVAPQEATYLVNYHGNGADANPGDGVCSTSGGACTLRAAIDEANLDGGPSLIHFASRFQYSFSIGDYNLSLTESGTTIDASDQWDTVDKRPGVQIGTDYGTTLFLDASQSVIKGVDFGHPSAIHIRNGGHNTIGGTGPGERNVFLRGIGVWVAGSEGYNQILGNYFGTVDGESSFGGHIKVMGDHNLISGNLFTGDGDGYGIEIEGPYNTVTDNIIGMNASRGGTLPKLQGIVLWMGGARHNVIGPNNTIAGNVEEGIRVWNACCNTITTNNIGYPLPGGGGNGSDGIWVFGNSPDTQILDNAIQANGGAGIKVDSISATIQGNYIANNRSDGIYVSHGPAQIGGSTTDDRNEILGNVGSGLHLDGAGNVAIQGNWIGLGSGAFDEGNEGFGILLESGASGVTIGGADPSQTNWIAWNHRDGIRLVGPGTSSNFIQGNIIGAPTTWGWPAPNSWHGIGIYDGADNNYIGGLDEGQGNVIVASGWSGIAIVNSNASFVFGNRIGTDGAGHDWGNGFYGLSIGGANHLVSGNEIAFNGTVDGKPGVLIDGDTSTGNNLIANSIHDHAGLGISLTNRANDEVAEPVLTAGSCQGPVAGSACPGCRVEIYSDADDEGKVYEDSVTADAGSGAFSWSGPPNGPNVTATATDGNNNTSQFSAPFSVGNCNTAPKADFTITPASGPAGTVFAFDASTSSDVEDPTSALQARWDWQNDGLYDTGWSTNKVAEHRFDVAATHTIRLQVKDSGGLLDATSKKLEVGGQTIATRIFLPLAVK